MTNNAGLIMRVTAAVHRMTKTVRFVVANTVEIDSVRLCKVFINDISNLQAGESLFLFFSAIL